MLQEGLLLLTLLGSANSFILPPNPLLQKRQNGPPPRLFENIPETLDLEWYPCSNDTTQQAFQCTRLSVPLDYKNPDNGLRAIIPILKYPASPEVPYKGSVLVNPGGPGGVTSQAVFELQTILHIQYNIVGPGYDIIGFDPRGIGYAVPYGSCGISPQTFEPDRQNASIITPKKSEYQRRAAFQIPPNNDEVTYGILIPNDPPSWKKASYDQAEVFASACSNLTGAYNQASQHMNTVVVATDMLSIGKALARERNQPEDSVLVNYYGISYGTLIGQYFATLYPSNVGKFFLDGVVDAETWINLNEAKTTVINTDKAWSKFFPLCHNAGPARCRFATGRNSHAIRDRFNRLTAKLNATRFELEESPYAEPISLIVTTLKQAIFGSIYTAYSIWPFLADLFVAVEPFFPGNDPADWNFQGIQEAFYNFSAQTNSSPYTAVTAIAESFTQVSCTDAHDIRGVQITDEEVAAWKAVSKVTSYDTALGGKIKCSKWPIRPSWEWYGPVGGPTKTPILFAGVLFDPITPYQNAEKARTLFKGAKMFYVDEVGHTTALTRNTCAFAHAFAYFQNGTLPGHNNRCAGETPVFY